MVYKRQRFIQVTLQVPIIILISVMLLACRKSGRETLRWNQSSTTYIGDLRSIAFTDHNVGLIVGNIVQADSTYSILLRTEDGGIKWTIDTCKIKNFIATAIFAFNGIFYLEGSKFDQSNQIYKSLDKGYSWSFVTKIQGGLLHFFDLKVGIMTDGFKVFRTINGGNDLTEVYSDETGFAGFTTMQFLDDKTGFIAGGASIDGSNYGMMARTSDGGQHWQKVFAPSGNIATFRFVSPLIGYAFYFPSQTFWTSDGGIQWKEIDNLPEESFVEAYFKSESEGYLLGGDKIFYTSTGAKKWEIQWDNRSQSGNSLTQLYFNPYSSLLFVIGHDGLILFKQTIH